MIVKSDKGYAGVLWNIDGDDRVKEISLDLKPAKTKKKEYTLITKTVDETCCNPLKLWHDLGEPAYPTKEETELIKNAAQPLVESDVVKASAKTRISVPVRKNGVVYFTLTKRDFTPDRGYDYDKVISFH